MNNKVFFSTVINKVSLQNKFQGMGMGKKQDPISILKLIKLSNKKVHLLPTHLQLFKKFFCYFVF